MRTNSFSSKKRSENIQYLQDNRFDLLVIGGGITGAGIALDAAARGLKVALLDMQDFAGGTSGRSTKLIHGGLRYLKQMEFGLVAEVGKERAIIHRNAPHLAKPEPMLMPITKDGSFGKFSTRVGMILYEWLAGVKKSERHQILNTTQTIKKEPLLKRENLLGAALFYEYRTDDARLTVEVMKAAVQVDALVLNYIKVTGFIYESGKIIGVNARDVVSGKVIDVKSGYIINASGPWVDELDSLDTKSQGNKLQITKGVHLVVDQKKLPVSQSLYIDTFDKRMIFVIPRSGKVYIGTTDTFYDGNIVEPRITAADKDYLLKCVNTYFQDLQLAYNDVESTWVGLRPLIKNAGKKPSEISRKDEIFVWPSGLITIAGGKLTGYRKMAQRVVDKVGEHILRDRKLKIMACATDQIKLSGGKLPAGMSFSDFIELKVSAFEAIGISALDARQLINRYGSNIEELLVIIENIKKENTPLYNLPVVIASQLIYCMENEMCMCPADFFIRRTGMLFFDMGGVQTFKNDVLLFMRNYLLWSEADTKRYEEELLVAINAV